MVKTKRLVAVALAILMVLSSFSFTSFAWDAQVNGGFDLTIKTEILRKVNDEWIKTDKVEKGETVKARVYLGTDYYTNSGSLLFFYSNKFFTDAYGAGNNTLAVNSQYATSYGVSGNFYASESVPAQDVEELMLADGRITVQEANEYDPIIVSYSFGDSVRNKKLDANKWFCEFELTVKEDAPAGEYGRFLAFEKTAASLDYSDGYIDVPKGTYDTYVEDVVYMFNWNANLIFDNAPVELYQNLVKATFNANGGEFTDGSVTMSPEGEAGSALTVKEPVRSGYEFAGWRVSGTDDIVDKITAYPDADTTYEAVWKTPAGEISETLGFRTEIHRYNEETGEYEKTDRVKRGETVKARLFIDTSYFTNAGDIIVFYENDFFTDAYPTDTNVEASINKSATSSAALTGSSGSFTKASPNHIVLKRLIENDYITSDFAKKNNAITIRYRFDPDKCAVLSGDEWFVEFDLVVLETAEDWGDFFIVEETIQNTTDIDAYINIPYGEEGWGEEKTIPMFQWNVQHSIESNPVTVESRITLEGEGGTFAETGEGTYVIDAEDDVYIGDKVTAPADPERDGYAFMGWVDENGDAAEIPATMPYEDVTLYATWSKKVNVTFKFNNGDPDLTEEVIAGEPLVAPENPVMEGSQFIGWDHDPNDGKIIPAPLPTENPEEDTVYTAIFDTVNYPVYYYVLNPETQSFELETTSTFEFGDVINPVPNSYTVPEGYTLSPAYKDISFTTPLADGETMPTQRVDLYYKLVLNSYDATFDADGGEFADGTDSKTVSTVYGEQILAPEDPTKEGFEFKGWSPDVGVMDQEGIDFVATWEAIKYNAKYIVDGATYESFPTKFGEEVETPADPYKEGYTFIEWTPAVDATMPAHDTEYIAVFEAIEYDAIFKLEEDDADEDAYETIPVKYDDPITVPATEPEKEGYEFGGWVDENGNPPTTMDEEGKTFYAVWNPADDTKYVVETYIMNTDGTYNKTPDGIIEKTGTTGTMAEVTPNAQQGVYLDEETEKTPEASVLKAEILPDGSTVLKIYYAREEVVVTFDANDGMFTVTDENGDKVEKEEIVLNLYYGAAVVAPEDPTLTGYTFDGWKPAVVNKAIEDATYVAQWKINQYTISFDTDGGSEIPDITQDYNSDVTAPANPTKPGYIFDKWVDAEGNKAEVPAKMPAENTELTATWTPDTFDAIFDADGGEWEDGSTEQKIPTVFDQPITEPATDPEKEGYIFDGWVDEEGNPPADMDTVGGETYKPIWTPDFVDVTVEFYYMDTDGKYPETADKEEILTTFKSEETATYTPAEEKNYTVDTEKSVLEAEVAPDGSTVLKVYYALDKTTISFDVDGEVTEVEGLIGAEVPSDEVPVPEKEGHTFEGWKDAEGNVSKDIPATFPEDDITLEVVWTKISYELTYVVDDETVEDYPKYIDFEDEIPVPAEPTKPGYKFVAWKDADGKTPADYEKMPSKALEFVAEWKENKGVDYVLNVYIMDTEGNYPEINKPTEVVILSNGIVGEEVPADYTAPEGFTIDEEADNILTGTVPAEGTLVLQVYVKRNQYKLTVDVDGVETVTDYYYGAVVDPVADPTKEGNVVFAGWVDENGDATTIPVKMPAEDVYVKATWKISAIFDAGEGNFGKDDLGEDITVKDVPVAEGDKITPPEDPTRPGYEFGGWATEDDPETAITDFGTMDEDGESYVAIWEAETYEIIFMDKVAPGTANHDTLLYGVEVKFYSNRVIVNKDFETSIKGLRAIGDGAGVTRGLQQASANGISVARSILNILIVFLISGIWHGAAWNFIIWGLYFVVFLLLERHSSL